MESGRVKFGWRIASRRKSQGGPPSGRAARRIRRLAGVLMACALIVFSAPAGHGAQKNGNEAVFLVARQQIHDPFFEHSVVVMLPTTTGPLIVGLIINKPTRVILGKLFPESPAFKSRTEPAYFGGPVDIRVPSVAFHSQKAPEHALQVYGNIYLTFDSDLISTVFQNSQQKAAPRLFLGRAQWAPAQLENEVQRGSWYRVRAAGELIFSSSPQTLWRTLHDRAAPSKYIQYQLPSSPAPVSMRKIALAD